MGVSLSTQIEKVVGFDTHCLDFLPSAYRLCQNSTASVFLSNHNRREAEVCCGIAEERIGNGEESEEG